MGTRALIKFQKDDKILCSISCQFDGYPTGWGQTLANTIKNLKIVNGFNSNHDITNTANGIGCLAATVISKFKLETGLGGVYMIHNDSECEIDYTYIVYGEVYSFPRIRVESGDYLLWDGWASGYDGAAIEKAEEALMNSQQ